MRLLPAGDRAVLAELDSLDEVHTLHRAVLASGLAVDSVPGWRTLLVTTDGDVRALAEGLAGLAAVDPLPTRPRRHDLPTRYDGADLDDVATRCHLSRDEVVALHSSVDYVVAFLGFGRGFPYLSGLPAPLHLPRRATPRPRVPAGSVAVAHDQCGVYPSASPGGWHLLGTTDAVLFDPTHDPPSPFAPGDLVRFLPVP